MRYTTPDIRPYATGSQINFVRFQLMKYGILGSLDTRQGYIELLVLYVAGYTVRECAEILDRSPSWVYWALKYIQNRRKIDNALGECGLYG